MSFFRRTFGLGARPQDRTPNSAPAEASPGPLSDEDLMRRYLGGDVRAFDLLVQRHGTPLYNFILRSVGNPATAEDLVQDVFVRVVKNAQSFEERSRFSTWVYTIARNACVDAARRQSHRRHPSLDQPKGAGDERTLGETLPSPSAGSASQLMDAQFSASLETALASLPDEQREVFVMRQFQNLQFKEIADITHTPVNTVKSRMRYALEALRLHLADHAPAD
jgi:RNA polymerase sigma-70 factor (ECF subfamily)